VTNTEVAKRDDKPAPMAQARTIGDYLIAKMADLAVVAPKTFDMAALVPKLLQRASRNPQLLACTPLSFYTAVHEGLQLGLEPLSPHGHWWIVPRRNKHNQNRYEACGQLGYKGMIELALRSDRVRKVDVELVYEGEDFDYDRGTGVIRHPFKFGIDKHPDNIIGGYAVADLSSGARVTRPLERSDFDKARAHAQSDKFWGPYYAEMSMGVCVRRLFGRGQVPMTKELSDQLEREDERERQAEIVDSPVVSVVTPALAEPVDPLAESLQREVIEPAQQEDAAARLDAENRLHDAMVEHEKSERWVDAEARKRFGRTVKDLGVGEIEGLIAGMGGGE
jgi:recombination protein RecT